MAKVNKAPKTSNRVPATPRKSFAKTIKNSWEKLTSKKIPLRVWAKSYVDIPGAIPLQKMIGDWLFNKSANFSKPPLGIGSTRNKK
jgi:hypothetical protein